MIFQAAFSLLFVAQASALADRPLTVGEVWSNHRELNGKTIEVTGVFKGCNRWTCIVAEGSSPNAKYLSVDLPRDIRSETEALVRHRLIVEGRFDETCLLMKVDPPEGQIILCTDAATTLHSAKIVKVL